MSVSMRKMSPGDGYRYLLRSVVAGDGNRSLSTPLTRYYAEVGTPPGRWLGSGLAALGAGQLRQGSEVKEEQLALLIGMGRDPITGDQLGWAYPAYDGAAARAVAGFDFTFSVPKSVSVLWGLADADLQAKIVDAHHAAVAEVIDYLEREVATTRTGVTNGRGAVAQVEVGGVLAAAFDHWDSRAGDPQLHTHVVVSNKVKTLLDGRWRSLDSRPIHAAVTALSAHYDAVLADRLSEVIGVRWELRERGADRNPRWELVGVRDDLISAFSSRTRQIEREKDRLIQEYLDRHGHRPSNATIVRLRAEATLATRPDKETRSLADLTRDWRGRASVLVGADPARWARSVVSSKAPNFVEPEKVDLARLDELGAVIVDDVSRQRSTWRYWNLWASASRFTAGWRFRTVQNREAIVAMLVESAERHSLALTPPELAPSPIDFRRDDGTSVFRPRHSTVFSSRAVMDAEDRLLARAEDRTAMTIDEKAVGRALRCTGTTRRLSADQSAAVATIAGSGRRVDLLTGPAGSGKTTTMRALRDLWVAQRGAGSVVGLAPSAAAAKVLSDDLGIWCDNTAKWLHEYSRGNMDFDKGQLVIVDEATLGDTRSLDLITGIAANAGAKVLLVGDPAQLHSVDAGGAFSMLAAARSDVATLTDLHRFAHEWERAATLALRQGDVSVIDSYAYRGRLREGPTDEMLDAAYAGWWADCAAGHDSVLVTESLRAVHQLNARARAERILERDDHPGREVEVAEGARASAGDLVITRRNDRRLRAANGDWVRNGDRWVVTDVRADGSLLARRSGKRSAATVALPPDYVAEHVDLGYAITAHRAQGITVDTAHVIVTARTTRENLYVSMTRGSDSNIAYVALDQADDVHAPPEPDEVTARSVLTGVLQNSGAEISAHETIVVEQETWTSIAQVAAEYETIAAAAQKSRWQNLLRHAGLSENQVSQVVASPSFGPLSSGLRRAEAYGHDVDRLLARAVRRRSFADANDIGAVLHERIRCETGGRRSHGSDFIAGLIPAARGAMPEEHQVALAEREQILELHSSDLAARAIERREAWVRAIGDAPTAPDCREKWRAGVASVAAYRDRYGIESRSPLGPRPETEAQRTDAQVARAALRRAVEMSRISEHVPIHAGATRSALNNCL